MNGNSGKGDRMLRGQKKKNSDNDIKTSMLKINKW